MQEKVLKARIKRQKGYHYFVDKDGDISRVNIRKHSRIIDKINHFYNVLASEGIKKEVFGKITGNLEEAVNKAIMHKVAKIGVKRQQGYIYYIDGDGDISRLKLSKKARRYG